MQSPWGKGSDRLLNGANVIWRSSATATHNVHQAFCCKLMQQTAGHFGCLIKAGVAHGVGQTGVGVATDEGVVRHFGQLLNIGSHQRGPQSAVQANGQRTRMAHAVPKRRDGLATQDAARGIGHGATDDEGQALTAVIKIFFNGKQCGFGIQSVKNSFYQQHINTTFYQGLRLFVIGFAQRLKIDVARTGIIDIRADACCFGRRAQGTHGIDDAQVPRDRDYMDADNDQGEERMEAACEEFAGVSESGSL